MSATAPLSVCHQSRRAVATADASAATDPAGPALSSGKGTGGRRAGGNSSCSARSRRQASLPGSEPTDGEQEHAQHSWHERIHHAVRTDPRYADRLIATDTPEIYTYRDDAGVNWPVTFTREIADNSAGAIGLLTWHHPAFPAGGIA